MSHEPNEDIKKQGREEVPCTFEELQHSVYKYSDTFILSIEYW